MKERGNHLKHRAFSKTSCSHFQSDDAFVQILNAELLFGHCGVELLHFIREEDGLGEGIEDASVSPMG